MGETLEQEKNSKKIIGKTTRFDIYFKFPEAMGLKIIESPRFQFVSLTYNYITLLTVFASGSQLLPLYMYIFLKEIQERFI